VDLAVHLLFCVGLGLGGFCKLDMHSVFECVLVLALSSPRFWVTRFSRRGPGGVGLYMLSKLSWVGGVPTVCFGSLGCAVVCAFPRHLVLLVGCSIAHVVWHISGSMAV
jgi:hypothetical protein